MKKPKPIKNKQWLSIAEFSKKTNRSITGVHDLIESKKIVFQYFGQQKFIDSYKFDPKKFRK